MSASKGKQFIACGQLTNFEHVKRTLLTIVMFIYSIKISNLSHT